MRNPIKLIAVVVLSAVISKISAQDFEFIAEQAKSLQKRNGAKWEHLPVSFDKSFEKYQAIREELGRSKLPDDHITVNFEGEKVFLIDSDQKKYETTLSKNEFFNLLKSQYQLWEKMGMERIAVTFATSNEGAEIKYITPFALAGKRRPLVANGTTNKSSALLVPCFYFIWTERKGLITSDTTLVQIDKNIVQILPIQINEKKLRTN